MSSPAKQGKGFTLQKTLLKLNNREALEVLVLICDARMFTSTHRSSSIPLNVPSRRLHKSKLNGWKRTKHTSSPTAIYDWYLTEPAHNANATWTYVYIPGYKDLFFFDTVANR
jgi:hypothetical protein